eukprot:GHVT01082684.1.p1 GENE.GHVT01082684.1~~GHVT01082684.1.p1  ORF type:complete len:229 (-),score=56.79 GHVT01082684.1:468-1154(-)
MRASRAKKVEEGKRRSRELQLFSGVPPSGADSPCAAQPSAADAGKRLLSFPPPLAVDSLIFYFMRVFLIADLPMLSLAFAIAAGYPLLAEESVVASPRLHLALDEMFAVLTRQLDKQNECYSTSDDSEADDDDDEEDEGDGADEADSDEVGDQNDDDNEGQETQEVKLEAGSSHAPKVAPQPRHISPKSEAEDLDMQDQEEIGEMDDDRVLRLRHNLTWLMTCDDSVG